jgi:diguanylate cyclase (GGDEF)-like protein
MRKIYVLDDGDRLGEMIGDFLQPYGYLTQIFHDPDHLAARMAGDRPDAVVIGVPPHEQGTGMETLAGSLPRDGVGRLVSPLIVASARQDFAARLAAVRSGASAFLGQPVDGPALLERLDELTEMQPPQPFRILLVDDDPVMGQIYTLALAGAGMDVRTIPDPTQVIEAIHDFDPDLLITDLNMPQCSGFELAAVIRGHEALTALPIVFLTGDGTQDTRRSAVSLGGDAFLIKPVQLADLVETARARARRARLLRALMVRDSLTGALNHASIKEALEMELGRARRDGDCLCLAMIDIDHFKQVNDTYGHATGDRVIKSIARLMRQNLRRSDHIGRYGGEEFAVILPRTNLEDAYRRLEDLRKQFSQLAQPHANGEFRVTFSAGLVGDNGNVAAGALVERADDALYTAKRSGRNRVVAGPGRAG